MQQTDPLNLSCFLKLIRSDFTEKCSRQPECLTEHTNSNRYPSLQNLSAATVAIGKPERQVRKASHCDSKQQ